jgi:trehalose 6-phosphate synthase
MREFLSGPQSYLGLLDRWKDVFKDRELIVASNRGPVEYQQSGEGKAQARRGSGGVVTALNILTNNLEFTWVASAMGEGDRKVAQQSEGSSIKSEVPGHKISLRYVLTPRRVYHKFYNVICNPLLWFLQHSMWSSPYTPNIDDTVYDAWNNGYVSVNQSFAEIIIDEAKKSEKQACILIHDYHLYLTAGMVRKSLPDAIIQYFLHIPWPGIGDWHMLPRSMRDAICGSLVSADIVGFQTKRDAMSFLQCCETFLDGCAVDYEEYTLQINDHKTHIKIYPLSIDTNELKAMANTPRAEAAESILRPLLSQKNIVRIDRVEPSKNIVRGFRAYSLMLSRSPDMIGHVKFLAFLVPSRSHIKQYQRYMQEVEQIISEVNEKFGTDEWKPIEVFYENNYTQAIAAMKLYDVLLVNPIIDGMNLVTKEAPIVNYNDGVLIISDTAGAYSQLKDGTWAVSPSDVEGTARALYQAVTASKEDRSKWANILKDKVEQEDIANWIDRQIDDISAML